MNRHLVRAGLAVAAAGALAATTTVAASGRDDDHDDGRRVGARLTSFQEVPALSTPGRGWFRATVDGKAGTLSYRLSYWRTEGTVAAAHLHLGQPGVNGGVVAWLCGPSGGAPAGTPTCPEKGVVSGTIDASDVVGPAAQGLDPGEFAELVRAIRHHAVYVNVHTDAWPGGEIRGQVR